MCGLLSIISRPNVFDRETVQRALQTLAHRGPDGAGLELFNVSNWDIWMGHRRLAIVDLSTDGAQPFRSNEAHDAVIVFNGEVYNHHELRRDARGRFLRSTSDTEVLLTGIMDVGQDYLKRVNGMFAFAYLDMRQRSLLLGRDRIGKKPLYIYQAADIIAVASELKALIALGLKVTVDESALAYFRWTGYIPDPLTIYREIRKFPAATCAQIDLQKPTLDLKFRRFWDPLAAFEHVYSGTYEHAVDELAYLVDDAVKLRLDADVPVGTFLSGGIDSSVIVASVAKFKNNTMAMTVRLDDFSLDESRFAIDTGRQLGVDVTTLKVEIPQDDGELAWVFDEPFADISQVPMMTIARAAREHVKCVLTGDGGDEIFLGYPWLTYPGRIDSIAKLCPTPVAAWLARSVDSPMGHVIVKYVAKLLGLNVATTSNKVSMIKSILLNANPANLYDLFKTQQHRDFLSPDLKRRLPTSLADFSRDSYDDLAWEALEGRSLPEFLGAVDFLTFLKDDVLVKVDRATMAYGLEARSPLLDYRVVQFAHSLPLNYKISDGVYKRIMRDLLRRSVDGEILGRSKQGFGIPVPSDVPSAATPSAAWASRIESAWRTKWEPEILWHS